MLVRDFMTDSVVVEGSYCTDCKPCQQLLNIFHGHDFVRTPFATSQIAFDLSVAVVRGPPACPGDRSCRNPRKFIIPVQVLLVVFGEVGKLGRIAFDLVNC